MRIPVYLEVGAGGATRAWALVLPGVAVDAAIARGGARRDARRRRRGDRRCSRPPAGRGRTPPSRSSSSRPSASTPTSSSRKAPRAPSSSGICGRRSPRTSRPRWRGSSWRAARSRRRTRPIRRSPPRRSACGLIATADRIVWLLSRLGSRPAHVASRRGAAAAPRCGEDRRRAADQPPARRPRAPRRLRRRAVDDAQGAAPPRARRARGVARTGRLVTEVHPVVVVGAGAAGLMAAISAAKHGARTVLLEGTSRLGTKILMSGGTRCNVTHDVVTAADYYGGSRNVVARLLREFSHLDTVRFFEDELHVAPQARGDGQAVPGLRRRAAGGRRAGGARAGAGRGDLARAQGASRSSATTGGLPPRHRDRRRRSTPAP